MTDKLDCLRNAMTRKPDAARVELNRETVEALLGEIDRLTEQRDNMVAAHALAQISEQNARAALAAAPQPAPEQAELDTLRKINSELIRENARLIAAQQPTPADRDALIAAISSTGTVFWNGATKLADALLARGLRLRLPVQDEALQQLADLEQPADHMVWDEAKLRDIAYRMLGAKVLPELSELLQLRDYLEIPVVEEATALGVELSHTGYSRQSDIRGDQYDDAHAAMLMRALRVAIRVVEGGDDDRA